MMTEILIAGVVGALAGAGVTIWRLKGQRSWLDVGRAIVRGGGGPGAPQ